MGIITGKAWKAQYAKKKKPKYKNKKVEHAGRRFDSKAEKSLFDLLLLRQQTGEIHSLRQQHRVTFRSGRFSKVYIPDFSAILTESGDLEYFEYKGFEPPDWSWKCLVWQMEGPGILHIYKGPHQKIFLAETIIPDHKKT